MGVNGDHIKQYFQWNFQFVSNTKLLLQNTCMGHIYVFAIFIYWSFWYWTALGHYRLSLCGKKAAQTFLNYFVHK